jgi:uncharacterized phage protein (TIGR02216 family)
MSEPFPWAKAMAIGFGVLRLSPDAFWRLTPSEFAAALRGLYGDPQAPMRRESLNELIRQFPDGKKK